MAGNRPYESGVVSNHMYIRYGEYKNPCVLITHHVRGYGIRESKIDRIAVNLDEVVI